MIRGSSEAQACLEKKRERGRGERNRENWEKALDSIKKNHGINKIKLNQIIKIACV
jgi:hypothetical protein